MPVNFTVSMIGLACFLLVPVALRIPPSVSLYCTMHGTTSVAAMPFGIRKWQYISRVSEEGGVPPQSFHSSLSPASSEPTAMMTVAFATPPIPFLAAAAAFLLTAGLADEGFEGPFPFTSSRWGKTHFPSLCIVHSMPLANLPQVGLWMR